MKIHMRFDESNAEHTHLTLFINGQNCGQLCVGTKDIVTLHMIISHGLNMPTDEFISSGKIWSPPEGAA